jgi:hypothetical protein
MRTPSSVAEDFFMKTSSLHATIERNIGTSMFTAYQRLDLTVQQAEPAMNAVLAAGDYPITLSGAVRSANSAKWPKREQAYSPAVHAMRPKGSNLNANVSLTAVACDVSNFGSDAPPRY